MSGWIKIHRTLLEWGWLNSPNHVALFLTLLLRANYKTTKWRRETLSPGQLLTGRKQLSIWTGLSEQQVRTALSDLKATNEITIKTCNRFSIITITNWDMYQQDNQQDNRPTNQRPTNGQPTDNHIQEVKKVKKEKNINTPQNSFEEIPENLIEHFKKNDLMRIRSKISIKKLQTVIDDYGVEEVFEYIVRVDDYVQTTGKKYKCYVSAARNWLKRDGVKKNLKIENVLKGEDDEEKVWFKTNSKTEGILSCEK
jgi:hypothetical protein